MSIDGLSSNANLYQVNRQNDMTQRRQDFKELADALQSGDLSGARQAFSDLQKLTGASNGDPAQSTQSTNANNTLAADFSALGKALQSGDLSSAQDAFSKLIQGMQAGRRGHHHHAAATSSSTQDPTPTPVASLSSIGSTGGSDPDGDNDQTGGGGIHVSA